MKQCNTCGITKDHSEFSKKKLASWNYGLTHECKQCKRIKASARYINETQEDRSRRIAKAKEWKANNRDVVNGLKRKYRLEKKVIKLSATPHDQHVKEFNNHCNGLSKSLKIKHDHHVVEWKRQRALYARWKVRHDKDYAINQRMRVSIRKALKSNKAGRKWESIVGYTLDELKVHFIKTMPKGRTLDDAFNGKMHIDHIVPKSIFDLSNEDQIKQAWCLMNLRLVDAKDNLSKGDKCIYLL